MTFCCGNSCGIKCLSQQRVVTWTVCADVRRRGSGRPSGPWGSPSTGNSSTSTLPGLTTSLARVWASQQSFQDTVWQDRCWWAGNVVSLVFCVYFLCNAETNLNVRWCHIEPGISFTGNTDGFSSPTSADPTAFVEPNTRQQWLWLGLKHTVDS